MDKAISIVIPVYNEEENLRELYSGLRSEAGPDDEIIFVNDGSKDGSLKVLEELARQDTRVKIISYSDNKGQTPAIASGIKAAKHEIVVTLDADLQNDPADIKKLASKVRDEGYDVASGWRKNRDDAFLTRVLPSRAANFLISAVTGIKLHDFGCTLKAYRKKYVDNISIHGEMHRLLPAYCAWQGAKVTEVIVAHKPRVHGESKYGLGRIYKVILDLIVLKFVLSYITKPMHLFGGIALLSFLAGLAVNLFVLYRKVFIQGEWLSPLFFIGVLLWAVSILCFLLGILAELIVRVYFETKMQKEKTGDKIA